MSDLREKINGLVMVAADCFASPSQRDIERCGKVTDRILALLPKMPELRWDGAQLFLGSLRVGFVAEDRNGQMLLHAGEKTIGGAMPMDVARAAVEAAVRKALGWEA